MRSYRASLGTVIGVLLVGLGALILGTTYFIATSSVRTLAAQQFREVSRRQVTATQAHLRAAVPAR